MAVVDDFDDVDDFERVLYDADGDPIYRKELRR